MAGMTHPTHDPGADGVEPDATIGKLPLHPAHPAAEAADVLLGNQSVRREDPIAQEADALFAREDDALVPMDSEPQGLQKMLDLPFDLVEPPLVIGKDEKVINVADVTQPEMVSDEMIKRVEVDVGEELAGLVAQRQTPTPLGGGEQVVAGEPHQHRVLRVAVVDDRGDEPQDMRVFDLASDQS